MKSRKLAMVAALLALLVVAGCTSKTEPGKEDETQKPTGTPEPTPTETGGLSYIPGYQFRQPEAGDTIAIIKTSMGDIKILLFPNEAPKAVENFVTHSKNGYYDNLTFHRVIDGFIIQGGDPKGDGTGGESIWGEPFEDEFSLNLLHYRGALSMANAGENTNGSQFFIVQREGITEGEVDALREAGYPDDLVSLFAEHGGTPGLNFVHSVFGQVFEGMDVVDRIAAVETDKVDKPLENIIIHTIEIQEVK
ncbi:MAG: peptidylprolyl isomerase [Clostridiaceae bacterium]|jgi:peptidyl-prolyl cis-trans isomerase B (cyclophilin B)|nr:peptidylprolyl isomerase [Clostridiaceae bacterium]